MTDRAAADMTGWTDYTNPGFMLRVIFEAVGAASNVADVAEFIDEPPPGAVLELHGRGATDFGRYLPLTSHGLPSWLIITTDPDAVLFEELCGAGAAAVLLTTRHRSDLPCRAIPFELPGRRCAALRRVIELLELP